MLLLTSCNGKKKRLQSDKGLKVRFEIRNLQKKLGDCDDQNGDCAQIDLVYPFVTEGVSSVKKAINDSILAFLIQNLVFEEYEGILSEANLKMVADSFLLEWKKAHHDKRDESASSGWEVSVTGEVGLHTPKVASVSLGSYSYAGGAHPNSFVAILNFNLKTGATLDWPDFITDINGLKKLAEKKFKEARELPNKADLNEEGYFWDEPFALPANFELQEEGIYFWYNPYEAAAYAQGPTDFLIPYSELGKLVRKDVIF